MSTGGLGGGGQIAGLNSGASQAAQQDSIEGYQNAEGIANAQALFQTKMGRLQMLLKINEALAKMLKALGDAIKGLV
jgi:hypothetical protein